MFDVSNKTLDELKLVRKHCLYRYAETTPSDPRHVEYGRLADMVGYELNRRTGEKKWKL